MHLWVWAEKRKWKNTRHINYAFLLLPPSQAICLTADQMTRNYTAKLSAAVNQPPRWLSRCRMAEMMMMRRITDASDSTRYTAKSVSLSHQGEEFIRLPLIHCRLIRLRLRETNSVEMCQDNFCYNHVYKKTSACKYSLCVANLENLITYCVFFVCVRVSQ